MTFFQYFESTSDRPHPPGRVWDTISEQRVLSCPKAQCPTIGTHNSCSQVHVYRPWWVWQRQLADTHSPRGLDLRWNEYLFEYFWVLYRKNVTILVLWLKVWVWLWLQWISFGFITLLLKVSENFTITKIPTYWI